MLPISAGPRNVPFDSTTPPGLPPVAGYAVSGDVHDPPRPFEQRVDDRPRIRAAGGVVVG